MRSKKTNLQYIRRLYVNKKIILMPYMKRTVWQKAYKPKSEAKVFHLKISRKSICFLKKKRRNVEILLNDSIFSQIISFLEPSVRLCRSLALLVERGSHEKVWRTHCLTVNICDKVWTSYNSYQAWAKGNQPLSVKKNLAEREPQNFD